MRAERDKRHFGPVVPGVKFSSACISSTRSGDIDMVMSIVLNMMPNTTISEEGGHALCSDSHTSMSCNSQPNLQKSFSAFSGGAVPMKSSR